MTLSSLRYGRALLAVALLSLALVLPARADITGGSSQDGSQSGLAGRIAAKVEARTPSITYAAGANNTNGLNDFAAAVQDAFNLDKVGASSQVTWGTNTAGQCWMANGTGTAPTWGICTAGGVVSVNAPLTGNGSSGSPLGLSTPLAIGYGGTNGTATPAAGGICYGTGTAYAFTAAGSSTAVLHGTNPPTFSSVADADLSNAYSGVGACTNQFVSGLTRDAAPTCTTDTLASAQHANQGTTTTLLHGNAAGNPSWAQVADADLANAYSGVGSCTNQFVTGLARDAAPTCTTATLAGAQFANQGTTTTVLHGNAAGAPSWSSVALGTDVSGTLPEGSGGTGTGALSCSSDQAATSNGSAYSCKPVVNLQNSTPGTQQTGSLNISGTATASTAVNTQVLDTPSAGQVLSLGPNLASLLAAGAPVELLGALWPQGTAVADVNHTVSLTFDNLIDYTSLTASRIVTLPGPTSSNERPLVFIVDGSGSASPSKTIGVQGAVGVTINGSTGAITCVNAANGWCIAWSNGTNWFEWGQATPVSLTSGVSGTLPIANGGTNSSTALTNNRTMVSEGGGIFEAPAGTSGQIWTSQGAGFLPSWMSSIDISGNAIVSSLGAGGRTPAKFWVETADASAGATTARFGATDPLFLGGNLPGIGFNEYYDGAHKYGSNGYSFTVYRDTSGNLNFASGANNTLGADAADTLTTVDQIANNGNLTVGAGGAGTVTTAVVDAPGGTGSTLSLGGTPRKTVIGQGSLLTVDGFDHISTFGGLLGLGGRTPTTWYLESPDAPAGSDTVAQFGTTFPLYLRTNFPSIGFNLYFASSATKYGANGYGAELGFDSSGNLTFYNAPNNTLGAGATATPTRQLQVAANGAVGIGSNSPTSSVQGGDLILSRNGAAGAGAIFFGDTTNSYLYFDGSNWNLVTAGAQGRILQEGWTAPSYVNGWGNYSDANYNDVGYYKDSLGIVHLRGLMSGGTMTVAAFVLPAGYRPPKVRLFATVSNGNPSDQFAEVRVDQSGNVIPYVGNNGWFSLSNVSFDTH